MKLTQALCRKHSLNFKQPSGTSRGVLHQKDSWIIQLQDEEGQTGLGESSLITGLSEDDKPEFEAELKASLDKLISDEHFDFHEELKHWPAIRFGIEMALLDLKHKGDLQVLDNSFSQPPFNPIPINGLIWMGEKSFMLAQIKEKIEAGFDCIKMKVGAISFDEEIALLKAIRSEYSPGEIEIRVDANGAFEEADVLNKLSQLSELKVHSIEQPIKQGNWEAMADLCDKTPLPIALDEELIGIHAVLDKARMLRAIRPQHIIIKPSLVGGFQAADEWIAAADELCIPWWATSALESNVGLNAIAQWTATKNNPMPQGLGTGSLYTNNIKSPLVVKHGHLHFDEALHWEYVKFA